MLAPLALVAATSLAPSSAALAQDPPQDAAVEAPADAAAARGGVSAHAALIVALAELDAVAPAVDWEFHSLESHVVSEPKKGAADQATFVPHVRVQIELTTHAEGGGAAEDAFVRMEIGLAQLLEAVKPTVIKYDDCKQPLLSRWADHTPTPPEDDADRRPSRGSHTGVIDVTIPLDQLGSFARPNRAAAAVEVGADTFQMWARRLAQDRSVQLGNVKIRERKVRALEPQRWSIAPMMRSEDAGVGITNVANFMYLAEHRTSSLDFSDVSIVRHRGTAKVTFTFELLARAD